MQGRVQVNAPSLREHLDEIKAQLTAKTIPLSHRVEASLQSVQQIAAAARQTLEHASAVQGQVMQLRL